MAFRIYGFDGIFTNLDFFKNAKTFYDNVF